MNLVVSWEPFTPPFAGSGPFSYPHLWVPLIIMNIDFRHHPVDATAAKTLAESHFRLGLVDTTVPEQFRAWLRADARGFHKEIPDDASLAASVEGLAYRRTTGVWAEGAEPDEEPVGTISSWPAELSLPGERSIDAWAVSSVTVSPAKRRRGIARALLEAELATAAELGLAVSILTVTETTIYGRYGFAPAGFVTDIVIDPRRATWVGPTPAGSIDFVSMEDACALLPGLHNRSRQSTPGQIDVWDMRWKDLAALTPDEKERAKRLRAVRFLDDDGDVQGLALYRVLGGVHDFVEHRLELDFFLATTEDASAALWRFLLGVDLVSEIRAEMRSVSERLRWQVADQRGIKETVGDHLWARILDVPAALSARGYSSDGRIGLEVSDPFGYAEGRFLLTVNKGIGSVEQSDQPFPEGTACLGMSVNELSALYLGGVSAGVLSASGRVVELSPGAALAADFILHSPVSPFPNIWF